MSAATNTTMKQRNWSTFLKLFSEQNRARPTRLGVLKSEFGATTDYWIEDGLPLAGIDVDAHGEMPTVEIMLGDDFTHTIKDARNIKLNFSFDGNGDGLDITDADGKTTILRFEN